MLAFISKVENVLPVSSITIKAHPDWRKIAKSSKLDVEKKRNVLSTIKTTPTSAHRRANFSKVSLSINNPDGLLGLTKSRASIDSATKYFRRRLLSDKMSSDTEVKGTSR